MLLSITKPAVQWFKKELELDEGATVRFFIRSGGCADVGDGFSIGIAPEQPQQPIASETLADVTFFIEESDQWFFENKHLNVKYKRKTDDIHYILTE
ncbi:hypothetical protein GCM10011391_05010 [Pullulanibacillus camelliae]|uniref:Core domain-containing protein n=1 Tax=Pullulanibacillus camelliae TaxID=1707096 RepID=A0A8J2YFE1_9BACL|nr:HesB/YadR/YfhF family protein [Pullulanibacillus camelliae]GGE29445.1 hypothetical protein GCM10011391_05010 [Pullulanibacillus camelliae]